MNRATTQTRHRALVVAVAALATAGTLAAYAVASGLRSADWVAAPLRPLTM